MGMKRIGNSRFRRGRNSLGRNAWLLRDDVDASVSDAGSTVNLLDVSGEGAGPATPSPELVERLRRDSNWSGLDLSGLDLRDVFADKFSPTCVDGTDFSGSDLRGVSFARATGSGANFTGALTEGILLHRWTSLTDIISGGSFDVTNMRVGVSELRFAEPTRLVGFETLRADGASKLAGADFSGETLVPWILMEFSEVRDSNFTGAVFADNKSRRSTVVEMQFINCDFSWASMTDVYVRGGVFSSCRFDGADLTGWRLNDRSKFHDCDFGDANMSGWGFLEGSSYGVGWYGENKLGRVDLTGTDGTMVKHLMGSEVGLEGFKLRAAAEQAKIDVDELGVLAWAGEVEVRDLDTFDVVDGVADDTVWVPGWSVRKLVK